MSTRYSFTMPETRTLWPPNAGGTAPGECMITRTDDGLFITRADPHVWIDDIFLRQATSDNPWVTLVRGPVDACDPSTCCQVWRGGGQGGPCFTGGILTIKGVNRVAAYRIGRYLPRGAWDAHQEG